MPPRSRREHKYAAGAAHIQLFASEPSGYIVLLLTSADKLIQRVEHALRKTLVLVVRLYSGGGSSRVEWTAHIRLHYPLFVLQMTISPVRFSTLK